MVSDVITSKANLTVKLIKSLRERKYRREHGLFLIEGEKFVKEALLNGIPLEYAVASQSYGEDRIPLAKRTIIVSDDVFAHLSEVKTPQGIMAACSIPENSAEDLKGFKRIVYLNALQLPDNVGAIIRSAACAGYEGVIIGKGCADCFSPKAVRASASNLFRIAIFEESDGMLDELKEIGFYIAGAHLKGDVNTDINRQRVVLIIGNEGNGMSDELTKKCDGLVKIPIKNGCESLNAASAAALLMYKSMGY